MESYREGVKATPRVPSRNAIARMRAHRAIAKALNTLAAESVTSDQPAAYTQVINREVLRQLRMVGDFQYRYGSGYGEG